FVDNMNMISTKFPSINSEFKLNWQFDTGTQTDADLPTVEFDNVTVDMGTFLSSALEPILKDIQVVTQPLEPLIHVLKTPIPGISDLSEKLGGGPVTLESLAKFLACGTGSPYCAIVTIVSDLVDIIDTINGINLSNGQVGINLGNFSLGGPNDS